MFVNKMDHTWMKKRGSNIQDFLLYVDIKKCWANISNASDFHINPNC